ncbi:MAG: peptidylprolyl isomerase [Firmicutes bacterium]|nr:peptidylprolyl isomerase [Bacillota bacterium]
MKRITALFAVIVLAATMFAGCDDSTLYRHYDASAYEKQFAAPEKGDTMAEFTTNMGTIVVRLFPKEAPKAVENFVTHAQEGYYDGVIFHRVIADFMIQSGDPDGTGYGGDSIWGGTFEDELCPYLSTYRGALCMANSGTNTNKSQFFIVTRADKDVEVYQRLNMEVDKKYRLDEAKIDKYKQVGGVPHLDYQMSELRVVKYPDAAYQQYCHTVFGQVVEGMDIVDAISNVKTCGEKEVNEAIIKNGKDQTEIYLDKPVKDVIIESIRIYTYGG